MALITGMAAPMNYVSEILGHFADRGDPLSRTPPGYPTRPFPS
jgi:hypothetical protein